jgi:hypothetical protein
MVLEGIVEEWGAAVVLKSLDGKSIMIVHNAVADIMLTKVMLEPQEISEEKEEPPPGPLKEEIANQLREVLHSEDSDLEKMNISQLRKLVIEQDKQLIAQKKKEHFGTPGHSKRAVPYSSPYMVIAPRKK